MSSPCLLKTESTTKSGEKKTSKKRKVTELTHGRYSQITDTSTEQLTSSQYQCNECQKIFSSEQGVKTHVYMTHILNSSKENIELPSLQCTLCFPTRTFPNEDALFQHNRSRHSQLSIPIPSHVTSCPSSSQISTEPDECPICGLHIETSLEEHLNSIIPSEPISLQCSICHKIFHTERSLRQHLNFCSLSLPVSSENHDKTVELTDNVESF